MNFPLDVQREINRARSKHHAPIHSLHEGYAVMLEEVDELWERVKMQNTNHEGDVPTYRELVQIGAMAQRIAEDVIRPNNAVRGAAEPRTLNGLVGHSGSKGA